MQRPPDHSIPLYNALIDADECVNGNLDNLILIFVILFSGKKFVLSMPPHVAYTIDLISDKRFIQNDFGNETFLANFGQSGTVVLPDFTNLETEKWFTEKLKTLLGSLDTSAPGKFGKYLKL